MIKALHDFFNGRKFDATRVDASLLVLADEHGTDGFCSKPHQVGWINDEMTFEDRDYMDICGAIASRDETEIGRLILRKLDNAAETLADDWKQQYEDSLLVPQLTDDEYMYQECGAARRGE